MTKLTPCPFCGGKMSMRAHSAFHPVVTISEGQCWLQFAGEHSSPYELDESDYPSWNRREQLGQQAAAPPRRWTMDDIRDAMSIIAYAHMSMEDMSTLAQDIANNLNFRAVAPPPVGLDIEAIVRKACKENGLCKYLGDQCNTSRCTLEPLARALSTPPVRGGK